MVLPKRTDVSPKKRRDESTDQVRVPFLPIKRRCTSVIGAWQFCTGIVDLLSFMALRKPLKIMMAVGTLIAPMVTTAVAANFEATKNDGWFRCATSSECIVIDVGGCPWGISAVNRRYSEDFREWAQAENARHDCYKIPGADKKRTTMFGSECINQRCEVREKVVAKSK